MSPKSDTGGSRGMFAEIRSFVFTLAVVILGIAFIVALFTGGIGSAEGLLANILDWIFDLADKILSTIRNAAAGVGR